MRTLDRRLPPPEALVEEYVRTRAPALRDEIVEGFLYIAEIIARRFSGRGVEYDDLYQVAALALVKGLDRFDASKGVKFASFITPTMVGEVKNYFRDRSRAIRLPRRGALLAKEIRDQKALMEQQLGRSPRVDELAQAMNLTEDAVLEGLELNGALSPASLDAPAEGDDEGALGRILGFEDPGYADFEQGDMLNRAMVALDDRQRDIIRGRFFEGLSQRDLARRMGISQMTVSRAERQALSILRERMTGQE